MSLSSAFASSYTDPHVVSSLMHPASTILDDALLVTSRRVCVFVADDVHLRRRLLSSFVRAVLYQLLHVLVTALIVLLSVSLGLRCNVCVLSQGGVCCARAGRRRVGGAACACACGGSSCRNGSPVTIGVTPANTRRRAVSVRSGSPATTGGGPSCMGSLLLLTRAVLVLNVPGDLGRAA